MVVDCPPRADELDGVVEFGSASQRMDFVGPVDSERPPRVARMTPGVRLAPVFGEPDQRLESKFTAPVETVRRLSRERMWDTPYALLGTNSNSAMRCVFEECGLWLPDHVLSGGGILGEFPGVDFTLGAEIERDLWGEHGLGARDGEGSDHGP